MVITKPELASAISLSHRFDEDQAIFDSEELTDEHLRILRGAGYKLKIDSDKITVYLKNTSK